MQHYVDGKCVDNAPNEFYVGLPQKWSNETKANHMFKCAAIDKECLKDSESVACVSLKFICIEDSMSLRTIIIIVSVLFAVVCCAMCVIYVVLQRRLANATRINAQFLSEMRVEEEQRRKETAEKAKELQAR